MSDHGDSGGEEHGDDSYIEYLVIALVLFGLMGGIIGGYMVAPWGAHSAEHIEASALSHS